MISAAVMAHPARRGFVEQLLEQLDRPTEVIWDRRNDRWDTGRRSLLAFNPAADFHLILQDDAIVCRELIAGAERAVALAGKRPVGFYLGDVRPNRHIVVPAAIQARRAGATWLAMEGPWWGVAIAVPTAHIPALVKWCDDRSDIDNFDRRISRYYAGQGIECWYTLPSLVDHRSVAENPSLIAGRSGNRRAHWFIGRQRSALEIEWDASAFAANPKDDLPPPHPPRHHKPGGKLRIADRRIYAHDSRGRLVLVAAPGQPIPAGFEVEGPLPEPEPQAAPQGPTDNLDGLTVRQLRDIAEARGVSLAGAARKNAIVARLRQAPDA